MRFAALVTILVTFHVVCVSGITLNALILVVNFTDWKKSKRLQPVDGIHIASAVVSILLQCVLVVQSSHFLLNAFSLSVVELLIVTYFLTPFLIYVSFWLNAWLCVYFVSSIANFRLRLFAWMKSNITHLLPKLVLVSAVGSFSISVLFIWHVDIKIHGESYDNITINPNFYMKTINVNSQYQLTAAALGCFLPFIISSLCLGHTLYSLLRHVYRVKCHDSGFSPHALQAYTRAARTMILLFVLDMSYYLAQVFSLLSTLSLDDAFTVLSWFLVISFPSAQSFITIQASSKLREAFQRKGCSRKIGVQEA